MANLAISNLTATTSPGASDLAEIETSGGNSRKVLLSNLMAGRVPVYSDGTRPAAGVQGRVIYNTTDSKLNIDTGAAWTLPDGTVT